ncbi:MAG TPA: SRPBCC family protein [Solirubrobacteraceae bacterium]
MGLSLPPITLPGDDLIPDAGMAFDRSREIAAPPEAIWPWLVQLGKRRAGWYLPARVERLVPGGRRGAATIDPRWQTLAVGDRISDYGGRHETLEVALIDPPRALVYRSERRGAVFTWALVLRPAGVGRTDVHLRFRGRLRSTGWRRRALVLVGGIFDWATTELMLRGLDERVRRGRRH